MGLIGDEGRVTPSPTNLDSRLNPSDGPGKGRHWAFFAKGRGTTLWMRCVKNLSRHRQRSRCLGRPEGYQDVWDASWEEVQQKSLELASLFTENAGLKRFLEKAEKALVYEHERVHQAKVELREAKDCLRSAKDAKCVAEVEAASTKEGLERVQKLRAEVREQAVTDFRQLIEYIDADTASTGSIIYEGTLLKGE
ncbi:hypothetical protein NE237_029868 [Protea cynaroides]|uniref:Uncharacterized protein n=1 Tax=Protea cynaroides TaxID=273540 RepID=A0A9Q0GU02_9MAGN|nr:hypothetical protein NE237_029868 [Protea cynaroides]